MKLFINLFLTFIFLLISITLLIFAFLLIRSPEESDSEAIPEITQDFSELESIFLGHDIFLGSYEDRDDDPHIHFDLRYNERYLAFDHPIFPADEVTDEEIINWITAYLYGEYFFPWEEARRLNDPAFFNWSVPFPWAVINLDDGSQLVVETSGGTRRMADTFLIAYRQQNSEAPYQRYVGWVDTAYAIFIVGDPTLQWRDFIEGNEGDTIVRYLRHGPFD